MCICGSGLTFQTVLCPHSRFRNNVDGKYLVDQVPFSCCSTFSPRPCIQQQVSDVSAHFNYDQLSQQLNLWRKGCRQALMEHYTSIVQSIGLMALLIWMFEVLMSLTYVPLYSLMSGNIYIRFLLKHNLLMGSPSSAVSFLSTSCWF